MSRGHRTFTVRPLRAYDADMDIAIAGGHGKIALLLAGLLHARGDHARSLIRNPDHADDVRAAGGDPVVCDLEQAAVPEVARAIEDADAVVFAAGAGPGSGAARKWTVDFGAAAALIAACKLAGVERYVMVSAMGAAHVDDALSGGEVFEEYLRAKAAADRALQASGLRWTVVRPGRLTDDAPTGRVSAAERLDRGDIPRADVAAVVMGTIASPGCAGVAFDLVSGPVRIEEAVAKIGR